MSSAVAASQRKAREYKQRVRQAVQEKVPNVAKKSKKIEKLGVAPKSSAPVEAESEGLDYLYRQGPKDSFQSTSLTSQQTIDFEIKQTPNLKTKGGDSWWVEFTVAETGTSAAVTPAFVEAFLDVHAGIEFLMNQRQICPPLPMMHVVIEQLERVTTQGYTTLSNQLNHNVALLNTSVTQISASGSIKYRLRLPTILPRHESFWLGAIDGSFTIRLRTQTGGAVAAGSGVLSLTGIELVISCIQVPDNEIKALEAEWMDPNNPKVWKAEESRLNEVAAQTVASTGQYLFQLQALKDQPVTRIISFAHASRTSFATGTSYFLFLAPNTSTCNVHIQDKSGAQLFTSNKEGYGYNKYVRMIEQYGPDSPMPGVVGLILNNCSPDLEDAALSGKIDKVYVFSGDENLSIENFGSAATTMFVDSLAFIESVFTCKKGIISKVSA